MAPLYECRETSFLLNLRQTPNPLNHEAPVIVSLLVSRVSQLAAVNLKHRHA